MQTDKTADALKEFFNELTAIGQPVPADELARAKHYVSLRFPSGFETTGDISTRLEQALVYRLPDDYFSTYVQKIEAVTVADAQRVAQKYIQPSRLAVVIAGRPRRHRARHPRAQPGADYSDESRRCVRPGRQTLSSVLITNAGPCVPF